MMGTMGEVIARLRDLLGQGDLGAADTVAVRRELEAAKRSRDAARGVALVPLVPA